MKGVESSAPVAGMFLFAILYFGIMSDAGMLDPLIERILISAGSRPTRVVIGTTLLALLVHLDGSGAVTFLVTIPIMLPLYDRIGMDRPHDTRLRGLHIPVAQIFQPLISVRQSGCSIRSGLRGGSGAGKKSAWDGRPGPQWRGFICGS